MTRVSSWSLRTSPVPARNKRSGRRRRRGAFTALFVVSVTFLLGLWVGSRTCRTFTRSFVTPTAVERQVKTSNRSLRNLGRAADASWCGVWPAPCSGHGTCRLQRGLPTPYPASAGSEDDSSDLPANSIAFCQCDAGWAPPACDRPLCRGGGHCSGNGVCVEGNCVCEGAWRGNACDLFAAVETPTPRCARDAQTGLVCGGVQQGICETNGTCTCQPGWTGSACEQATLSSVYQLARFGAGTLSPCKASPSPQSTPFVVAVLPPAEQGRRWLGFQAQLVPTQGQFLSGTSLPWLCLAYDLAERLASNALVAAFDIVVTRWIEESSSGERSWLLTAAISVPETWQINATLEHYLVQVLPIKLGAPIHVTNVLVGHGVFLNIANETNDGQRLLGRSVNQRSAVGSSSVSVLEAFGIAAMGVVVFTTVLALLLVGDAWWQRRQFGAKETSDPVETSPRTMAAANPSGNASPSAPNSATTASSSPLGMNLEELVTISLSPERPWRYRSWRRR
ncbi:hypothetical protein F1559_004448 [Cyanidiococcus yangmingshanensis]|uniref:EGF-like domain-containing protein n=1 Tax=Cyanidiococcus yangmingshanensis TaxID=2690220 RepID=A0A7J7ILG0_9RHOD|nr:hypothetical protein F1559_004448 [Cyanidiococcus yangmingshanensis]